MIYTVEAFWTREIYVFLASNFLIFLSDRFAMLHSFYKQLRSGDSTESSLWLWVNFILNAEYYLFRPVSNMKKVFNFIISCMSLQLVNTYNAIEAKIFCLNCYQIKK